MCFGSFLTVLDGPSLHFYGWEVTVFGRKVFFTSLSSKFWRFFYLKRVANHHLPLSAFTTYGRVLSPHFSASTSSNGLLLSLSEFVVLAWMALTLFSSPCFIFCKETLPSKMLFWWTLLLHDKRDACWGTQFSQIISYVILKHFSNFIVLPCKMWFGWTLLLHNKRNACWGTRLSHYSLLRDPKAL